MSILSNSLEEWYKRFWKKEEECKTHRHSKNFVSTRIGTLRYVNYGVYVEPRLGKPFYTTNHHVYYLDYLKEYYDEIWNRLDTLARTNFVFALCGNDLFIRDGDKCIFIEAFAYSSTLRVKSIQYPDILSLINDYSIQAISSEIAQLGFSSYVLSSKAPMLNFCNQKFTLEEMHVDFKTSIKYSITVNGKKQEVTGLYDHFGKSKGSAHELCWFITGERGFTPFEYGKELENFIDKIGC